MNKIIQLIDRGDKGIDIDKSFASSSSSKKSKSTISKTNPKLFKDAAAYSKHCKIRELLSIESKPTDVKIDDNYMYTLRKKHYSRGHSLIIPGMDPEIHPKGAAPVIIKLRASSPLTPSRTSLLSPTTNLFNDEYGNRLESPKVAIRQSGPGWISRPTSELTQNSGRIANPVVIFRPPLRFITYACREDKIAPTMKARSIGSINNLPSPIKKEDIGVTTLKDFYLDPYAKLPKLPRADKHEIIFNTEPGPPLSIDYESSPNRRKKRPICRQNWT